MIKLSEIPEPPYSHYVGIIYYFEPNGVPSIMAVHDRDKKEESRINIKLPGGTNERVYEEYIMYENALFKVMERLNYNKTALKRIYKNERKREELFKSYEDKTVIYILRTMVLSCLKKTGYYPLDLEPRIAFVVEKAAHSQYFLEVNTLVGKDGEDVLVPDQNEGFRALDLGIKETRIPLSVMDFRTLILSHRTAVEKFLILTGKSVPPNAAEEEDE